MSTTAVEMEEALRRFVDQVVAAERYDDSAASFDLEFLTEPLDDALHGADYLGALEVLEMIDTFVDRIRTVIVITCRATGEGWGEIGEAMGRDRQWAWRTYHERADFTDELNEAAVAEAERAIPDFEALGFDLGSMDPEMRRAISMLEARAERASHQVRRAVQVTADARRRELVEAENEAERAKTPGRRPGPQPKRSKEASPS